MHEEAARKVCTLGVRFVVARRACYSQLKEEHVEGAVS
jgi:hypothetical protein